MTKLPFSNFDLPRQHLGGEGHYIPPRARDKDEIARRRSLPSGILLLEQQRRGLEIAGSILTLVKEDEDIKFTAKMIGMAALNTGWYAFAQNAPDVMRRRLLLPKLADHETDWRQTAEGLQIEAVNGIHEVHDIAALMIDRHEAKTRGRAIPTALGRRIGNVSLQFGAIHHNATNVAGTAFEVQKHVRDTSLDILESTREFGIKTGSHPSIAQLADPDSPLAVHWRRTAPDGAYEAYETAVASY